MEEDEEAMMDNLIALIAVGYAAWLLLFPESFIAVSRASAQSLRLCDARAQDDDLHESVWRNLPPSHSSELVQTVASGLKLVEALKRQLGFRHIQIATAPGRKSRLAGPSSKVNICNFTVRFLQAGHGAFAKSPTL